MKRLLCALIALMLLGSFACAETLRVGMECNYAPYNWTQTEASDEALPLSGGGYADGYDVRIAIARALVNEPEVLLLDEPLGALDLKLRQEMQLELKSMQQELGITFLYVTHDQEEALTMSDTIVVMNNGRIQQIGDPKRIYDEPKNAFVADFIGQSNLLTGVMLEDELVMMAGKEFPCVDEGFAKNEVVDVVVRPEDIMVVGTDVGMLEGVVESVLFKMCIRDSFHSRGR